MNDARPLAALLSAAVVLVGCSAPPSSGASSAMLIKVTQRDLVFESSFYGELQAAESHPILAPELHTVHEATVETMLPDGTPVKKGQTVLSFAKAASEEQLREKESDLLLAEASLHKVQEDNENDRINRALAVRRAELSVELAKLNVISGVNLISELDFEKAKVELARAELQLELEKKELAAFESKRAAAIEVEQVKVTAASEKVKDLRTELELMEVKAPADGMLYAPFTQLNWAWTKASPGKVARPGDKILEIPELDQFKAILYVRQRDAALLKIGDTATVTVAMFPDRPLHGKVVAKDEFATTRAERGWPGPQGALKEIRVQIELEPSKDPLRPGGTLRADVSTVLAKGVLIVSLSALTESKGSYSATRPDGSTVNVKIGHISATHAEVVGGLSEWDEVVVP